MRAICGNRGFFANCQPQIAEAIDVPFFGSSLPQVPLIILSLKPDQKVLALTANGPEMQRILTSSGGYNPSRLERELFLLAKKSAYKHPEIGTVLLECTELAAHGRAIQKAVGKPVWAFPDMINWMYSDGTAEFQWIPVT